MDLKKSLVSALFITAFSWTQAQVVVDLLTPQDAVEALLGNGVEASNITYTGIPEQLGLMTGAEGSLFPVAEGIIMSTDWAENFEPGAVSTPATGGVSGDQDLLDIANSVPPLIGQNFSVSAANDLCIIEFDFVPQGDSLSFNYSFGSNEYLEWVNSMFNDVFAFFLSGPGITGPYDAPAAFPDGAINIAILPDSDPQLPITISSVNNVLNDEYYIDNVNWTDVQQDGFTIVLTAEAEVECGQTYHIKLAIADGSDTALESIVVLEAGSFSSSEPGIVATIDNTGISVPNGTLIEGCLDGFITVTKAQCDEATELNLEFGGTAGMVADYEFIDNPIIFPIGQNSIDIPIITVIDGIEEGTETIEISFEYVDFLGDTIFAYTEIYIYDYHQLDFNVEDVFVCPESTADAIANVQQGISPYDIVWSSGGNGTSETFSEGSAGGYYAVASDFCEGQDTAFFNVIEPLPLVLNNIASYYCLGQDTDALFSDGTAPYSFEFDGDTLEILDGGGFSSSSPGNFLVTIIDACDEEISFDLDFLACSTVIPNVFTPTSSTNDIYNNVFEIKDLLGFPGSALKVFDRWGELVYENRNYKNTWDGDENPDGVYYYIFERSDGEIFTGDVTILRKNAND